MIERVEIPFLFKYRSEKSPFYIPKMICKPENSLSIYDVLILLLVCEISEPFPQARYFRAYFCIFTFEDLQLVTFVYLDRIVWDTSQGLWLLWLLWRYSSWKEKVTCISLMPHSRLSVGEVKHQVHVVRCQGHYFYTKSTIMWWKLYCGCVRVRILYSWSFLTENNCQAEFQY